MRPVVRAVALSTVLLSCGGGGTPDSAGIDVQTRADGAMDVNVSGDTAMPRPDVGADTPRTPTDTGPSTPSCRRPFFPPTAPWNQDVSAAPVDSQSATIIAALQAHGWGAGRMQIDFSIHVMCDATNSAPRMPFTQTGDFYTPDCDSAPVPIPMGGHLEGETGYNCVSDGDCHLIVVRPMEHRIYEQWRVDFTGGRYNGGCLAVWDTAVTPPATSRGEQCSSADAGGFPISAMLFDADEVAAGHIDHAIRFILPNNIIDRRVYVHPATHAAGSVTTGTAVPYGARLRIRADRLTAVLAALPNNAARTVAQAMARYGMILSDGGNIALTAEDDEGTTNHWSTVGLGARDLQTIQPSDFEMVEGGPRINLTFDCARTPITN